MVITTGYEDDTFRPSALVTRQAIVAFLYRLVDSGSTGPGTPSFSDVGTGLPFYDEIEWLLEEGLTTGYVDGHVPAVEHHDPPGHGRLPRPHDGREPAHVTAGGGLLSP
jgi:hypothetical protein